MMSELGEIDEVATQKTFERIRPALMSCYSAGLTRLDSLAGDVKFFIRVKADGHLRWGFMEQSTLGDRQTETCMLGVLSGTQWPIPDGGEAEVHQGLGFDPPPGVRPPVDWKADRVTPAVDKKSVELKSCKKHGDGQFQVTAYVRNEKGAGRVILAGSTAPNNAAADDIECLLGVVRGLKLPSPGSYPAKVSFSL
jgi:hypothetical protein